VGTIAAPQRCGSVPSGSGTDRRALPWKLARQAGFDRQSGAPAEGCRHQVSLHPTHARALEGSLRCTHGCKIISGSSSAHVDQFQCGGAIAGHAKAARAFLHQHPILESAPHPTCPHPERLQGSGALGGVLRKSQVCTQQQYRRGGSGLRAPSRQCARRPGPAGDAPALAPSPRLPRRLSRAKALAFLASVLGPA